MLAKFEKQAKEAESKERDQRNIVKKVHRRLIEYVDRLGKQQQEIINLENINKGLQAMVDAYGTHADVIGRLARSEANERRLSKKCAELEAGESATAEAVKSVLGRSPDGGGHADTVVVSK